MCVSADACRVAAPGRPWDLEAPCYPNRVCLLMTRLAVSRAHSVAVVKMSFSYLYLLFWKAKARMLHSALCVVLLMTLRHACFASVNAEPPRLCIVENIQPDALSSTVSWTYKRWRQTVQGGEWSKTDSRSLDATGCPRLAQQSRFRKAFHLQRFPACS